ncbi:hypothetical protein IOD16_14745 [Saccharothrix sp. 6-C]|nr:hypothetical protein IOD16_14745 [Saccharothrix sp. 6-C]
MLVAPVTVTPTKPLTPSHLKGLLWTDVLVRATELVADVHYRYSTTTYHVTEQETGFWEFLDRTIGDTDYSDAPEEEIGALYVRYRAGSPARSEALRPYVEAVEHSGWVHPASLRVLELWADQYRRLGMRDPGLTRRQPPGMSFAEVVDALGDLCLDHRAENGPVYLDLTREGMPLRRIADADGRPNYLGCALRDLVPLAPAYDEVVLLCDRELENDYAALQRVLARLGPAVRRTVLGRVPLDGVVRSARHGGWEGSTVGKLLDATAEHEKSALRLGMRLYFIAVLGPGQRQSFRPDLLRRHLAKAERLLADSDDRGSDPRALLTAHRDDRLHVDPYPLTSGLLNRHGPRPSTRLLTEVFT